MVGHANKLQQQHISKCSVRTTPSGLTHSAYERKEDAKMFLVVQWVTSANMVFVLTPHTHCRK